MISERAQNMPSSPIRKLAKYADAAKRNGVHVYHLNIGQPDILTPECALEAVRNIDRKVLEYTRPRGISLSGPRWWGIMLSMVLTFRRMR